MISPYSRQAALAFYGRARWAGLVGGDGLELVGPGYARAPIMFAVGGEALKNAGPVAFPVAPQPWGRAESVALFDDAGQFLISDPLATPIDVRARDQVVLPPGAVAVEIEEEAVI